MKSISLNAKLVSISLVVVLYLSISSFSSQQERYDSEEVMVGYPEGYRDWTHIKTYVVKPKNPAFSIIGGFNHVYANDKAMIGYKTGNFPNGSIIVSDVIHAIDDSLLTLEGARVHIDVMVKDTIHFQDPGGWRFETFDKESKSIRMLTPISRLECNKCHRKNNTDMVFSDYRK